MFNSYMLNYRKLANRNIQTLGLKKLKGENLDSPQEVTRNWDFSNRNMGVTSGSKKRIYWVGFPGRCSRKQNFHHIILGKHMTRSPPSKKKIKSLAEKTKHGMHKVCQNMGE